ncbi:ankyrin-1-like [Ornithodoros turicata]|uniref:ankyrin-1-like n=1 Tax=Ornithodoros turicata TaxID=34597 RepID=UPI0031386B00
MPSGPCLQTLQRELADSIIRCAPLDELRILLACGARVNEPVTQGLRPLHYAAYRRYDEAVNLLLVRGCDVDATDDVGYTALHLCAERGFKDTADLLLKHQARVCFTDQPCKTNSKQPLGNPPRTTLADEPLRLALKNGHYECAELLLLSGADPNARYFLGCEINLVSPLDLRSLVLLLRYGALPDARDRTGLTPLMKAARHPKGLDAVRLLVAHGADVNADTTERHDCRTVLHYAVLSGNAATVRFLLDAGAKAAVPPGYHYPTPLDFAVLRGQLEVARMLLDAGAHPDAGGSAIVGSPLHLALCEAPAPQRFPIAQLLLERGADPNALTFSERGGPLLRAPLGEYLASSDDAPCSPCLVRLLLKFGARAVLRPQAKHPLGILRCLTRFKQEDVLEVVIDASEGLDRATIQRNLQLGPEARQILMEASSAPRPLKHLARLRVRAALGVTGPQLLTKGYQLMASPLPAPLVRYLLYET